MVSAVVSTPILYLYPMGVHETGVIVEWCMQMSIGGAARVRQGCGSPAGTFASGVQFSMFASDLMPGL